jgi:hypothetical protein
MEMELLTTVGEQIGCLLILSRAEPKAADGDLVLSSGSDRAKGN